MFKLFKLFRSKANYALGAWPTAPRDNSKARVRFPSLVPGSALERHGHTLKDSTASRQREKQRATEKGSEPRGQILAFYLEGLGPGSPAINI